MKSIKNQYQDLKEGKMSQSNFMRNLRMTLPHLVTNITSFDDSIKILKNKGILTENELKEYGEDSGGQDIHWGMYNDKSKENITDKDIINKGYEDYYDNDDTKDNNPYPEGTKEYNLWNIGWLKAHREDTGEEDNEDDYEPPRNDYENDDQSHDYDDTWMESLNEDRKPDSGAKEYNKFSEIDNANGEEYMKGMRCEWEWEPGKTKEEYSKKVLKNLKKNPNYYTNYKLTGIEDYKIETMDSSKPEDHQMKPVKKDNLIDKRRGMMSIKDRVPDRKPPLTRKKAEKAPKKVEVDVLTLVAKKIRGIDKMGATGEKMKKVSLKEAYFQDLKPDPEKYKILRDSSGKIIGATNDEGQEFKLNDKAIAIDNNQEIQIKGFKESQGKVKAIYGTWSSPIDIDGLKKAEGFPKDKGNMGDHFDKFKKKLEELIRKELSNESLGIYGGDNVTDVSDDYNIDENQ